MQVTYQLIKGGIVSLPVIKPNIQTAKLETTCLTSSDRKFPFTNNAYPFGQSTNSVTQAS